MSKRIPNSTQFNKDINVVAEKLGLKKCTARYRLTKAYAAGLTLEQYLENAPALYERKRKPKPVKEPKPKVKRQRVEIICVRQGWSLMDFRKYMETPNYTAE